MYSNIPGVQILISLFKQSNIKHFVISPGTRNTPLVHSIENDNFFECYSIVDERSAGFFALGLAESRNVPVVVTCTAATATCNYLPAVKEAYEKNQKIIALTADQGLYTKLHNGDQNINQYNMFDEYVSYAVDLPKINNGDDYWFFNRSVNEALIKMEKENKPIQINYKMDYSLEELSYFPNKEIDKTRYIKRYNRDIEWKTLAQYINKKKIIIFCASDYYIDDVLKKELIAFANKTGSVIIGDYYSNIRSNELLNPSLIGDVYVDKNLKELKPDLIVLLGSIIYSPIKNKLNIFKDAVTWELSEDGRLNDCFRNVNSIFELESKEFFANLNNYEFNKIDSYKENWIKIIESMEFPNLEFTHFYVIKSIMEKINSNSLVHMSVLDAIRISNYSRIKENVTCFANIGADGIDGALSTFIGQAKSTKELSYLIIGDLSFLYDLNALFFEIPSNVRIIVINNYAGAEFHKNFGLERISTLNKHIAAGHSTKISNSKEINNFDYYNACSKEELEKIYKIINSPSEKPILVEIFTNADKDAKKLKEFWNSNKKKYICKKTKMKNFIKKIIGKKTKKAIKKIIKKIGN